MFTFLFYVREGSDSFISRVSVWLICLSLYWRNLQYYILMRSNKMQQYAGISYCKYTLHVSGVDEMELRSISSTIAANISIGWQYLKLYVQLCAPDDGRRNRLKHVERL